MGMNWYHRLERRYIEYGSSFEATRTFGLFRAMYDLVYNMNLDHLSWEAQTVFERLGDAGIRTAATPFLIYRGRQRHELGLEGLVKRAAAAANFRHAVWGPDEFFYGDLYASRADRLRPELHPARHARRVLGLRRREAGRARAPTTSCSSASPTTTSTPTATAPRPRSTRSPRRTRCSRRIVDAGGGLDAFLEDHAVLLTADHAQTAVEHALPLADVLAEDWAVLQPNTDRPEEAEIAVSPTSRAGAVYILDTGRRHPATHERARLRLRELDRVDLVTWLARDDGAPVAADGVGLPDPDGVEAVVERDGRELRFRPGGQLRDLRGNGWGVSGEPEALAADVTRGRFESDEYPDALARLWSALTSPHAGDILISATEGYECVDWGGISHAGGGSHGSLGRGDSLGPVDVRRLRPEAPGQAAAVGVAGSRAGDPRALRRRRRKAAGMSPAAETAKRIGRGTLKPGNWLQLFQFGLVGASGYVVNLACSRC